MPVNNTLTKLFKSIVRPTLYDTGALYASIAVHTTIVQKKLIIDITALEYLQYHVTADKLVSKFTSHADFSRELALLIEPVLQKEVADVLLKGAAFTMQPTITILINGN